MKESILIHPLSDSNSVRDESFFTGHAFSASSPETADEVRQVILCCAAHGITITPHGGLTGINGAGTATNNHSMNLQHGSKACGSAEQSNKESQCDFEKTECRGYCKKNQKAGR